LHRIALPVVSEWYQHHLRIHFTWGLPRLDGDDDSAAARPGVIVASGHHALSRPG
jgi:hypothetical protein